MLGILRPSFREKYYEIDQFSKLPQKRIAKSVRLQIVILNCVIQLNGSRLYEFNIHLLTCIF